MLTESLILLSSLAFLLFVLPLSGAGAFSVELQPSAGFAAQQDIPERIRARFSEAVLALQRSELQRALALQQEVIIWLQKNPEANQYFRATSLAVLTKIQVMADPPKAALASTQSAIAIFRTLPSSTNGMQAQLATVLQLQGILEAQLGELNAALASTDESVSLLLKSLLPGDPSVRSSLIASLMNRGAMHLAMVNSAEAIRSSDEALAILRERVQQPPEQRVKRARLLRNLSIMAQDLDRMKTALSYGQESVSIFLS